MTRRSVPSKAQVRMWKVEPAADDEPAQPTHGYVDPTIVRHGYTVTDLSRIVGICIRTAARRGVADLDEKRAAAMCAVIEELHRHECDPGGSALMRVAEDAISRHTDRQWANWGYNSVTHDRQKGFPVFWYALPGTPVEERVTERIAVHQITSTLTERQLQVLNTLVETGDRRATAQALGVDPTTVSAVLGNARRAFMALWVEHETPRPVDYRAGRSNPYSPEAAAARPEIARRAVRVREQRRAEARGAA